MELNPTISAPDAGGPVPAHVDTGIRQAFGEAPSLIAAGPAYDNDQRLLEVMEACKKEAFDGRWIYERTWWRNLLYTLGRHWIFYDRKRGQWVDKRMAKFIPRPVTNKVGEGVESIRAVFGSIDLSALARPIGGDPKNVAAAEVADAFQPFVHEEHRMEEVLEESDFWLIVTGNSFLHPYWDKDRNNGLVRVLQDVCLRCGQAFPPADPAPAVCPACQQPGPLMLGGADPTNPITAEVPAGRGRTDAISPLEIAIPPIYRSLADSPYVIRMRFRSKSYYEDKYGKLAEKISWDNAPRERSLQLLRTLATQSDVSSLPLTLSAGIGQELQQQGKTEFELWRRPNDEWPEGLFLRVIGDGPGAIVLRDEDESCPGPLPTRDRDDKPYVPFVHTSYQTIGGRLWARGPIDPVIQKQDQINQLDSLIQLIVTRVANPIWLEPKGAEVKSFTGEPGLVVKYNPLVAGGTAKPERLAGENIPVTLFSLRDQYLKDFEMLMGTYDVLKGARPPNVQAFSAMQLLVERAQARLAGVFKERGRAYRDWFAMALELERQFGPDERAYAVLGPNRGWTFQQFQKANLDGAIEIIVEDGSTAPKTNLGERASIEQANTLGLINPSDAEQRYAILNRMGLAYLNPSLDYDVKSALQEQDAFEKWARDLKASNPVMVKQVFQAFSGQMQAYQQAQATAEAQQAPAAALAAATGAPAPAPVQLQKPQTPEISPFKVKPQHDNAVHWAEHRKWGNADVARQLFKDRPELEPIYWLHLADHKAEMQADQAAAAPPAPAPKAGSPLERSNAESGNPHDVPHGTRENAQRQGPR
jgi:hypothetical protein